MILADSISDITWPMVALEAIKAAIILVPAIIVVVMAWINLRSKIADNTVKTEKNFHAIEAVQNSADRAESKAEDAVTESVKVNKTVEKKTNSLQNQMDDMHKVITKMVDK